MPTITQRVHRRAEKRGLEILTRQEWGTKHAQVYADRRTSRPHSLLPDKPADTLWQHITVTFDTGTLRGDFKEDMQTLERIGMERFGSGFSYNFGVDHRSGMVGIGQSLDAKGTHTINDKGISGYSLDQNAVSLAVAWIGMPGMKPTDKAIRSLGLLVACLIDEGALTRGHDYNPHSMVAWKDCPTDAGRAAMAEVNRIALDNA